MARCTFCGSNDVRLSASSKLDALAIRVRRALSFRRLYRCRSCDALFEAIVLGSISRRVSAGIRSNKPKNGDERAGSEGSHWKTGNSLSHIPERSKEDPEGLQDPHYRATERNRRISA
jgi:hypothetical protein